MAMLAALCAFRQKETIFCLHVNHSLRPVESAADAEFVAAFCEAQGIQCRVVDIPPGKIARFAKRRGTGIEAAARFFRRRALLKEAAQQGGNALILTAHTKDDLLETALMRILRGAGPSGLATMPVKKSVFLRPLLSLTRADVVAYLKAKNIPWREDSTNTDEKFLRNRIRRRLVPLLNDSFPSWKSGVAGMAETQSFTAEFIGSEAKSRVIWAVSSEQLEVRSDQLAVSSEDRCKQSTLVGNNLRSQTSLSSPQSPVPISFLSTDAQNFFAQPQIIREEALFLAIDRLLSGREGCAVRRAVVRRFCAGNLAVADLGPLVVRRLGGEVVLAVKKNKCFESGFSLLIKEPGLYNLKRISIEVQRSCTVRPFSARNEEGVFRAALPLVFRRAFNEDFFVVNGKKVSGKKTRGNFAIVISAVDVFGTAAFIGPCGLMAARDRIENERELFDIKILSNTGRYDD